MPTYNDSILKDVGRSYVVSSLLPASLFTMLIVLIFKVFIPASVKSDLTKSIVPFGSLVASFILFTVWFGFMLYSSQNFIIPFFEGYHLPQWLKTPLVKRQYKKHKKHIDQFQECKTEIEGLKTKKGKIKKKSKSSYDSWYEGGYNALVEFHTYAPVNEKKLLPTSLGNTLRASEFYPNRMYGFDGLTLWPRLSKVLPQRYVSELEEINNRMVFLINSAFCLVILAVACSIVSIITFTETIFRLLILLTKTSLVIFSAIYQNWVMGQQGVFTVPAFDSPIQNSGERFLLFFVLGLSTLLGAYLLYKFSVHAAEEFGLYIRAGYDLYRFDLLQQLNIKYPKDLAEEKELWERVSNFFIAGDIATHNFKYKFSQRAPTSRTETTP